MAAVLVCALVVGAGAAWLRHLSPALARVGACLAAMLLGYDYAAWIAQQRLSDELSFADEGRDEGSLRRHAPAGQQTVGERAAGTGDRAHGLRGAHGQQAARNAPGGSGGQRHQSGDHRDVQAHTTEARRLPARCLSARSVRAGSRSRLAIEAASATRTRRSRHATRGTVPGSSEATGAGPRAGASAQTDRSGWSSGDSTTRATGSISRQRQTPGRTIRGSRPSVMTETRWQSGALFSLVSGYRARIGRG